MVPCGLETLLIQLGCLIEDVGLAVTDMETRTQHRKCHAPIPLLALRFDSRLTVESLQPPNEHEPSVFSDFPSHECSHLQ
jgi:hypothetical protein